MQDSWNCLSFTDSYSKGFNYLYFQLNHVFSNMILRSGDTEMFEGDMILNKEQKAMATASVLQDNKSAKPGQLARHQNRVKVP